MPSRLFRFLLVCAALVTFFVTGGDTVRAVSSGVVISQVYGAGGNVGAALRNDYIELFNRGASSVSLAGMSVQYAATTGSSWAATPLPAVTLAPGQYFLVQESGGANGAVPPAADATGTISMAAGAGKVALSATTTLLSGVCPSGLVDFVGYGTGTNCFEGSGPTGTISTTLAAIRGVHGCTDTDSNNADFSNGAPAPRNTTTTAAPCGGGDTAPSVSSTTPAANATNISVNSTIVINFSESVSASASAFSLECPSGTPRAFTQSASPASSFTLAPSAPLPAGVTCAVKVTANQITDTDTADPPDTMTADFNFSFATTSPADVAPFVTTTSPANGAVNVSVTSPIVINFSESVTAGPVAFSILCGGVPQPFGQSGGPATSYTLTPTSLLPFFTSCSVSVTASQISDTDSNDPPDSPVSNTSFSFTTPPPGAGKVMINEVDADTPGTDTAEFVELYDGGTGNTPLDGLVVVFYDGGTTGSGNQSYVAFDLDGYTTNAQGYFTMGNPGVPGVSLIFNPGEFGLLQNGADAVALYIGNGGDFPNGTAVTTANLQDAIVYGTDDPSATGLISLVNAGQKVANENATGNSQTQSNQRCPAGMGGFRNTSPYYPGAPTPGTANTCPAARPSSDIVISQLYGGGGNGGATFTNDFVELYNRSNTPVDLTGWSLQYASSTGSGWDSNKQPLGGSIGGHEYYLIALASNGTVGAGLPPANISGQINMAAGSGKIALVNSFTGLQGNCPVFDPTIKDLVGYGSADCGEGSTTTAAASNSTALFRKSNGDQDTDNNANDFNAPATPSPRRTAAIVELGPNVLTTDPRTNGFDAPRDATIQVTFTEPVDVGFGWFTLVCASSGSHVSATFAVGFGGKDHYITPNDNFTPGEQCTVTILKNMIHDSDLDDSGPNTDSLPADYSWSFTVATGTAPPYPSSVHLTMGNPSNAGFDPSNYLMDKPEFTVSYNRDLGRPNWVSWHLSDEWIGSLTRVDTFRPDPQIPSSWYRVQSFDFSGSGFDRGHMTPNADRDKETSTPINQATFLMSNMVAQAPGNNQGPWAALEGYLRTLVDAGNELYIVSGPNGVGGSGSNGGTTNTLADGHVTVPSSTWKVALVLPKDAGDDVARVNCSARTIAVIMPNLDSIRPNPWENYLTTVDAVEALTGYDFFSTLPEPYQRCIEAGTNGVNPPLVKGDQTITFAAPADRTYGDPSFSVFATGGASGNPVTFSASGACTSSGFNGSTITTSVPGTCTVTASQAGSTIYNAAGDVARTFTINKATPAFAALTSPTIEAGTASVVVGGSIGSGSLIPSGNIAVTVNGVTVNVLVGVDGQFSATLATGSLSIANSPYVISFAYSGDTNFNGASDASALTVIDTVAPVVTYTGNAGVYSLLDTVNIHCVASDTGSGIASTTCTDITGPAYNFAIGVNSFSATATDNAGNSGAGSTSFTVGVTFADLEALVSQFSTNAGVANGLNAKLNAASHAPNANARSGQLGAFQNQVNAQTGKALTAAQAAILLRLVQALY